MSACYETFRGRLAAIFDLRKNDRIGDADATELIRLAEAELRAGLRRDQLLAETKGEHVDG